MYDLDNLKAHASGKWLQIIQTLAPQLSHACERPSVHVRCPCHGTRDGFRMYPDAAQTGGSCCNLQGSFHDGIATLQWANGWDFKQTVDAISSHLGLADGAIPTIKPIPKPEPQPKKDWSVERQRLQAIWDGSTLDTGRIAQYFKSRGITVPVPSALRLHPNHFYFHQGPDVRYPAILAQIVLGGEVVGIHQTWLAHDKSSKADVSAPRKSRKCVESMRGGAIRLYPAEPGKPLCLVEGIETGVSVHQLTGLPTWSCINSSMLEKVILSDSVREVYVGVDKDLSGCGQRAAFRLAKRLVGEGRKVRIALPPGEIHEDKSSLDWNDVLTREVSV